MFRSLTLDNVQKLPRLINWRSVKPCAVIRWSSKPVLAGTRSFQTKACEEQWQDVLILSFHAYLPRFSTKKNVYNSIDKYIDR